MASPYKQIFKAPGALGFSFAGFIARMPNSMVFISLTLMLSSLGYSYSRASYITASYVIASALISPQTARLADKYGQRLIVTVCTSVSIVSLTSLLIGSYLKLPIQLLILMAIIGGGSPNFGALVRTRWSRLYSRSKYIRSAFAFESILDEIIFMIGPIIAIAATTNIAPQAGAITAIAFLTVGSVSFVMQKKTEPKVTKKNRSKGKSVLYHPQIILLTIILFVFGIIYGAAELSAIAFCKSINKVEYSAIPLTLYALASFISGFAYGSKNHISISLPLQLLLSIALSALASIPFFYIKDINSLCFALFCSGATCAPTLIIASALVESIIPEKQLTEGISWVMTGLNLGVSFGYALTSPLIDQYGADAGFVVAIIAGLSSIIVTIATYKKFITK